jgi:hypothetical protein
MKLNWLAILITTVVCVANHLETYGADMTAIEHLKPSAKPATSVRFATFNTSLFRDNNEGLSDELASGSDHAKAIASIIHTVNPDVMLLNEFDYDGGKSAQLFMDKYLNVEGSPGRWEYFYCDKVNTGVDSGLDLDGNGRKGTPNDAWGFGTHPGQYGMLVITRFPIDIANIRTFQLFPWHKMPDGLAPMKADGQAYYTDDVWKQLRLSSKSHWDVPILIDGTSVHFLVAHPTPPVFDGPEDRNGKRNHDEIRMLRDYACSEFDGSYLIDDAGKQGDLPAGSHFVIAGDLNADPFDGDGLHGGIASMLNSASINQSMVPGSDGAVEAAELQGEKNLSHKGPRVHDTSDFGDSSVGNLRVDYVIPSRTLNIDASGVFWPTLEQLGESHQDLLSFSDHRMVWVDVKLPKPTAPRSLNHDIKLLDDAIQIAESAILKPIEPASNCAGTSSVQPIKLPTSQVSRLRWKRSEPCSNQRLPFFNRLR